MITFNDDAKKHMDNYLHQVRSCLNGCTTVDADEVEQNIKEHIENELQDSSEQISYNALDAVLKKLGSPQQWVPEEEISWWRKIILRLRTGPEDWRLACISLGLLVLAALFLVYNKGAIFLILAGVSFIFSRAAVTVIGNDKELGGQKWMIYPSLVVVYLPIFFFLLIWPVLAVMGIAVNFDHAEIDMFPWNTGNETPFWWLVFIFIAGVVFLWWLVLALVHKVNPRFLGTVFRPFIKKIKLKSINWFMVIMAGLAVICILTVILMLKYQGWSVYFIEILG